MMRVGTTIPFRSRGSLPPLAASPTAHGAITGKYRGHGITLAVEIRQGFQAKDGSPRANARDIEFPDGTSLSLGQSRIDAPYEETEND